MSTWEKLFADADLSVREPRRPFDVGAGLRRIAQDSGYVQPPAGQMPKGPNARRRLGVMARVTVTQAGAASHVEELTALLGDADSVAQFDGWTDGVDIEGVQVFACMLYLAHHPESARFWWRFAAGAGYSGAAYCLYLDHLARGEDREARFWRRQVTALFRPNPGRNPELDPEEFLEALEFFTGYSARNNTSRPVATGRLEVEFERLADRQDDDGLVCRPDALLADRIHDLAGRP
ncbi:hypothetical protein [Streptomyces sp. WAC01280]|uniref:hypothetical protein n=1 Tax=Streptomyces sp. WAC01280 TaxID=2487424 RepID=UPI000F79A000|nr:hypothetical protein [Streptomyces sp. WAC01280]RSS57484.1 hypothetical protein EF909_16225 [Streptomyces sp. WAC01280]